MVRKTSKKAAVEMSLNLIIMLVIGLTVMGLVIGFVTKMMGQASDSYDISTKEDEANKQRVESSGGYFAVEPELLNIPSGGSKKVYVKINNLGSDVLPIAGLKGSVSTAAGTDTIGIEYTSISGDTCILDVNSPSYNVQSKATQIITIQLDAPKGLCNIGDEGFINIIFSPPGTEIIDTKTLSYKVVSN